MKKIEKILGNKKYVKIKLNKISTRHFVLKVKINGVKGRFILDTGASKSCVDLELISKFNLHAEDCETKAVGAGATGLETLQARNNSLKINSWKTEKCHLILFDMLHVNLALTKQQERRVHGIIGADILQKGKAIIDYNKQLLYLKSLRK